MDIFKIKVDQKQASTPMLEDRLNVLALLSNESDILRQLSFGDIIISFIRMKSSHKVIYMLSLRREIVVWKH